MTMIQNNQPSSSCINRGASSSRIRKYNSSSNYDTKKRTLSSYLAHRNWHLYKNCDLTQLARNHLPFLKRLDHMKKLPVHDGCVNTICWNKTGEYILSGSDDCYLCITKPLYLYDTSKDYTVLHKVQTRHLGNIFSAQFIPNSGDSKIVSCCSRGLVKVHDIYSLDPNAELSNFNCHSSTVYEVVTVPDNDNIFLSCGDDKTIRLFDMRTHTNCARADTCPHPALITNSHSMTTLNLHPLNSNLMLIGRADGLGLVYDRRRLPDVSRFSREAAHAEWLSGSKSLANQFKYRHPMDGVVAQFQVPDMDSRYRFTSLCYNKDGSEVLASFSGEYLYMFKHDKSSNIELVQTLPKKAVKTSQQQNDADQNSSGANRDSSNNSSDTGSQDERRSATLTRIRGIRVRGDWSNTGIDSVPNFRMSLPTTNVQTATAFLEQITVNWRSRNNNPSSVNGDEDPRRTMPMTELIVGPINYNSSSNDSNSSERRQSSPSQSSGLGQHSVNEEEDLEDEDKSDHGHSDYDDDDNRNNNKDDDEANKMIKRISPETKAKFKKTLDGLKDKYGRIPTFKPCVKYQGHRNCRTSIKEAIFWGDNYIMSGSDCGRIVVWEKDTANIIMAFQADERVVNCLAPNPHHYALASSGIDYDIKIWSTQSLLDGPLLVSDKVMSSIVERNEMMLEESNQTFSVPPHLFFRVLASLARS